MQPLISTLTPFSSTDPNDRVRCRDQGAGGGETESRGGSQEDERDDESRKDHPEGLEEVLREKETAEGAAEREEG